MVVTAEPTPASTAWTCRPTRPSPCCSRRCWLPWRRPAPLGWSKPRLLLLFVLHLLLPPARSSIKVWRCEGKEDQILTTCWETIYTRFRFWTWTCRRAAPTCFPVSDSSSDVYSEKKKKKQPLPSQLSERTCRSMQLPSLIVQQRPLVACQTDPFFQADGCGPNQESFSGLCGIFFFFFPPPNGRFWGIVPTVFIFIDKTEWFSNNVALTCDLNVN